MTNEISKGFAMQCPKHHFNLVAASNDIATIKVGERTTQAKVFFCDRCQCYYFRVDIDRLDQKKASFEYNSKTVYYTSNPYSVQIRKREIPSVRIHPYGNLRERKKLRQNRESAIT